MGCLGTSNCVKACQHPIEICLKILFLEPCLGDFVGVNSPRTQILLKFQQCAPEPVFLLVQNIKVKSGVNVRQPTAGLQGAFWADTWPACSKGLKAMPMPQHPWVSLHCPCITQPSFLLSHKKNVVITNRKQLLLLQFDSSKAGLLV